MPCFHPIPAVKLLPGFDTKLNIPGVSNLSPRISFKEADFPFGHRLSLPCGQCVGCRLERSRQWAIRCVHEASLYEKNSFITLTFSPEYLDTRDVKWGLNKRDFQLFMKRLRKKFGDRIRYYHCGEYGQMCGKCDKSLYNCQCSEPLNVLGRPHYHACLFGFDFPDKEVFKITDGGSVLYTSKILEDLWTDPKTGLQMGFCTIGDVTFESAAYVARYIMKKITGDKADDHYVDYRTGVCLQPEYTTMSRRPGIGRNWLDKYMDDVYPRDFVVLNDKKMRPPRYYDGVLRTVRPYTFDDIKCTREENAKKHVDNCTPERLQVREAVQLDSLRLLPRNKDF